jgi:mRNA interferase RelE/StbE
MEKLSGANDLYRVRESDYRIIYQVRDATLLVLVVRVGYRKDVYRKID